MRIIFECGLVGRAHFSQLRAARFENFADAKPTADLDELAARDHHLGSMFGVRSSAFDIPVRQMSDDEDQGGCAIVDYCCRFGVAKQRERSFDITAAPATFARRKSVFEVRIA